MASSGDFKQCSRCGIPHEEPTGKRKCKRPLPDGLVPQSQASVSTPEAGLVAGADGNSIMKDSLATLITIVSSLATRMDAQQDQLNQIQGGIQPAVDPVMPTAATGAIPKRPQLPQPCAWEALSGPPPQPDLAALRADPTAVAHASHLVDALDIGPSGNANSTFKSMKRGWARPGGESAPRVPVPWPQDFVIGQGRKPRLLYDELDVLQWAQGCLSIAEREPDVDTLRAMLAQFRLTLRDAQSYGFEAARFAFGSVLSLMEDGTLVWGDGHRLSEERRAALVARAPHQREQREFRRDNVSGFARSAGASISKPRMQNIPNSPGGDLPGFVTFTIKVHVLAEGITSRARLCGNTCASVALGPIMLNQLALYPGTIQGHHRLLM
jgi:hypothetical protein